MSLLLLSSLSHSILWYTSIFFLFFLLACVYMLLRITFIFHSCSLFLYLCMLMHKRMLFNFSHYSRKVRYIRYTSFSVYLVLPHDFPWNTHTHIYAIYACECLSVWVWVWVCELNFRILLLLLLLLLWKRHTAEVHELWLLHRAAESRYINKYMGINIYMLLVFIYNIKYKCIMEQSTEPQYLPV